MPDQKELENAQAENAKNAADPNHPANPAHPKVCLPLSFLIRMVNLQKAFLITPITQHGEHVKNFAKKFGNAAIFGAGATAGADAVKGAIGLA